jgi:endonuclease/exonuclease/phosphatase family metal-dependent hydrolase
VTKPSLSIVLWNIEFRERQSNDGRELRARIQACEPDLVCITEGYPDFLDLPHVVVAGADYGYPNDDGRRKVLLWSRAPWQAVDAVGHDELPPGRYVAGSTETPIGPLRVHGLCIPWAQAHVRTGRRDRRAWDEHRQYLAGLGKLLRRPSAIGGTLVLGDYNQRLPRRYVSADVHAQLLDAFPPELKCPTEGLIFPLGRASIDHLHHSANLASVSVRGLSNLSAAGRPLSDHFGLHVVLQGAGDV